MSKAVFLFNTMNPILILLLIGLFAGILSGMLGIGGGVIIVPALVFFMAMTQAQAQGTSLGVLIMPVVGAAAYQYYQSGNLNWKYSLCIAITFVIGGWVGSKIALEVDKDVLKKFFAVFLLLLSCKMLFWDK